MSLPLRSLAVAALAAGLAAVPACNRSSKPKVAVVTNCVADFWELCKAGAQKAADAEGVELVFRMPPKMDVSSQNEIIEDISKTGLAGIAVSVINPEEQTPKLRQLASRMNLVAIDNDAPQSNRVSYIGTDNYEAGKAVARLVKKALPTGGTVALFIGSVSSDNAKNRIAGVLDGLADAAEKKEDHGPWNGQYREKYGAYTLYHREPYTDAGDEAKAQDNAKDVIEKLKGTPDLALVGLYAYNPKHILIAARSKGAVGALKIVGFDEDWVTLEGIEKGEVVGTVVQDPFNFGLKSVELLAQLAKGRDKANIPDGTIPYRVVTKDGGPEETVGKTKVVNLRADGFAKKLRADIDGAKK